MSNYPPGVTGNEYQIAGPSSEEEIVATCPNKDNCDYSGYVTVETYGSRWWWTCPECGHLEEGDVEGDYDDDYEEPEPDWDDWNEDR